MSFTALRVDISSVVFDSSDTSYIEFYTAARKVDKDGKWNLEDGYQTASDASVCTIFSSVRIDQSYSKGVVVYLPFQAGEAADYTFRTNNYLGQTTAYDQEYFDLWGAHFKYKNNTVPSSEIDSNTCIEVESVTYVETTKLGVYNRNTGAKLVNATVVTNQMPSGFEIKHERLRPIDSYCSFSGVTSWFPEIFRGTYGYYYSYEQRRYLENCDGHYELFTNIHITKYLSLVSDPGATKFQAVLYSLDACSSSSSTKFITEGNTYSATFTANSGFYFDYDASGYMPVHIKKGIEDVEPSSTSRSQFSLNITNVTDRIRINALAFPESSTPCEVHKIAENCAFTDSVIYAYKGQPFTLTCRANTGHVFSTVDIINGDTTITNYALENVYTTWLTYNSDRTEFTLTPGFNLRGEVTVIAKAIQAETRTVTNTLSNCTTNNSSTASYVGIPYEATITANTNYKFSSTRDVTVMMGSTVITPTFASDMKSFTISIAEVTDNITITATASAFYYSITNTLTRCTNSNSATTIQESSSYSATVTANTDYTFLASDVSVKMNGVTVPVVIASDKKSFTISISSPITGDITINATATNYVSITNLLTKCSSNNSTTSQLKDTPYSATITAYNGYIFNTSDGSVSVTMGDTAVTPTFASNKKSFTINIASITGPINISAKAIWEVPTPSSWSAGWVWIPTPVSSYEVVSSSIRQTADSIDLKVSKGDVTSQLLMESDQITLESGRLVISSGNFQLDANGHMTAVGATLSGGNSTGASVDIESSDITFYYNNSEIGSISTSYGRHGSYYYNCIDIQASSLNLVANDTIFLTSNSGDGGVVVNGQSLYVEDNYDGAQDLQKAPLSDFSISGDPIATLNGFSFSYSSNYGYILCCDSYTQYKWDADILSGVNVDNVYRVPVWSPNKSW